MKNIPVVFLVFLFACQNPAGGPAKPPADSVITPAAAPQPQDTTTLGGGWYLQPVLASDTATGKTPWLQLDLTSSRFAGNTGCNSMHGKFYFSNNDSSLSFGDKFAISKMACPGYNEPAFLKSLGNTTHFKLRNGILTLIADDHSELSRWMRKPASPGGAGKT